MHIRIPPFLLRFVLMGMPFVARRARKTAWIRREFLLNGHVYLSKSQDWKVTSSNLIGSRKTVKNGSVPVGKLLDVAEEAIMGFRPPKGVRPPQLEGKRTGRPKGSRNYAKAWSDVLWGYEHRDDDTTSPPTTAAYFWWGFARHYPDEVEDFLRRYGQL